MLTTKTLTPPSAHCVLTSAQTPVEKRVDETDFDLAPRPSLSGIRELEDLHELRRDIPTVPTRWLENLARVRRAVVRAAQNTAHKLILATPTGGRLAVDTTAASFRLANDLETGHNLQMENVPKKYTSSPKPPEMADNIEADNIEAGKLHVDGLLQNKDSNDVAISQAAALKPLELAKALEVSQEQWKKAAMNLLYSLNAGMLSGIFLEKAISEALSPVLGASLGEFLKSGLPIGSGILGCVLLIKPVMKAKRRTEALKTIQREREIAGSISFSS